MAPRFGASVVCIEVWAKDPTGNRKLMKRNLTASIFAGLTFFLLCSIALGSSKDYKVIRAVDGDTVVVAHHGKQEKVRLLCIDTPESVHPDKKQNIPMGKVASDFTSKRLLGKSVDLEFGPELRDRYGRLLAYVLVEGKNFNLELVRQGLSPYYTKYGLSRKYDQDFREAEKLARKDKLNIWGDPELTERYMRLKSKWGQEQSKVSHR